MKRELVVRILVDSSVDDDRLVRQFESLFEFGTARETIAEGLHLLKDPRLLSVVATRPTLRRSP